MTKPEQAVHMVGSKMHDLINHVHGEFNAAFPEEAKKFKDELQRVIDAAHVEAEKVIEEAKDLFKDDEVA